MSFDQFALSPDVQLAVRTAGFTEPTPIQERAIPLVLGGRDLIGSAQTGTGKTAAFALPILTRLDAPPRPLADGTGPAGAHQAGADSGDGDSAGGRGGDRNRRRRSSARDARRRDDEGPVGPVRHPAHYPGPRAVVIEPTRELALQVEDAFKTFGRFSPVRVSVMYGGVGYARQSELLGLGVDVWVGTPGRMLDFLERGDLTFRHVQTMVLDEADRLLDMGFLPDVRRLLEQAPRLRQTLLFSATIPPEIQTLAEWALREPERVEIGISRSPAETVTHALYPVAHEQKFALLHELLERSHYQSVIVFCRMKTSVDLVASQLEQQGHKVAVLHSDRNQRDREESLAGFRDGRLEVMVATDIASRGLDIAGVTHVINFDVPQHPEDYVHRIGRTGRARQEGDALTIFTAEDVGHVQAVERFIGQSIPRVRLENFPYVYSALFEIKEGESLNKLRVSGGRAGKGYSYSLSSRRRR